MQLIFLPPGWTLLIVFILWPLLQITAERISRLPSARSLRQSRFFADQDWEKSGAIYNTVFKIRQWKHLLPDGAALAGGYTKKHLADFSRSNLEKYLEESCRAELSHWLALLPFWIFGFIAPLPVIFYMLIYALAINLPCIMAQRFNRPRIARLLEELSHFKA